MTRFTEMEFDSNDLLMTCKMDGVDVAFLDPDWSGADFANFAGRTAGGAVILNAFLPGAGLVAGGIIGAFSFLMNKGEGYYDKTGKKHWNGGLYRKDINFD